LDGFEDVTFDGYHGLRGINRPDIYSFTLSSLFTIY